MKINNDNLLLFPADIPLAEVKLGELGSWLGRRQVTGIPSAVSRAFWRWQHKVGIQASSILHYPYGSIYILYCT